MDVIPTEWMLILVLEIGANTYGGGVGQVGPFKTEDACRSAKDALILALDQSDMSSKPPRVTGSGFYIYNSPFGHGVALCVPNSLTEGQTDG